MKHEPPPPLVDAILGRLEALREEYAQAKELVEHINHGLADILLRARTRTGDSREDEGPRVPPQRRDAGSAAFELQERLAAIPGVVSVEPSVEEGGNVTLRVDLRQPRSEARSD